MNNVKVAAICIGTAGADYDTKMAMAIEYLHIAGKNGVSVACLPEAFSTITAAMLPSPAGLG